MVITPLSIGDQSKTQLSFVVSSFPQRTAALANSFYEMMRAAPLIYTEWAKNWISL